MCVQKEMKFTAIADFLGFLSSSICTEKRILVPLCYFALVGTEGFIERQRPLVDNSLPKILSLTS